MNQQEFLCYVWSLEELLMQADHLRNQIGKCESSCDIEEEELCPECCIIFEKLMAENKRLAKNKKLDTILKKLKLACEEDKTGEFEKILKQFREGKVVH